MKLGICYSVSQEEFKQNGTKKMEDVLALGYDSHRVLSVTAAAIS